MNKLIYSPDASSYALNDASNRVAVSYGVSSLTRRNLLNANRTLNVSWQVSQDIYNYLKQVYRWFIASGGNSFLCDLLVDEYTVEEIECRFVTGSLKLDSVQGETYNVSAQFRIKPVKYDVVNKSWTSDTGLNRVVFKAEKGSFVFTAKNVDFHLSALHSVMPTGVYILGAKNANLSKRLAPHTLSKGQFDLTVYAPTFNVITGLIASAGSFSFTGIDAGFTYVTAPSGGWNPLDGSPLISAFTFSNSNKTILHNTTADVSVRATDPKTSGKWYFEIKLDAAGTDVTADYLGVIDSTSTLTNAWNANTGAFVLVRGNGVFFTTGPTLFSFPGTGLSTGDVIGIAFDVGTDVRFYFNNTLIETVPFTAASVCGMASAQGAGNGMQCTIALTSGDQTYGAPSGYLPLISPIGWNPAASYSPSKFTFSNSNKTITGLIASGVDANALATLGRATGKYHFEATVNFGTNANIAYWIGVCSSAMALSGRPGFDFTGGNFAFFRCNGQYTHDAGFVGSSSGQTTGVIVGFDVDVGLASVDIYCNNTYLATVTYTTGATVFPACCIESSSDGNIILAMKLADFAYSLHSGYSAWE